MLTLGEVMVLPVVARQLQHACFPRVWLQGTPGAGQGHSQPLLFMGTVPVIILLRDRGWKKARCRVYLVTMTIQIPILHGACLWFTEEVELPGISSVMSFLFEKPLLN